jgi:two-component system chemotaxis response regulator CheY
LEKILLVDDDEMSLMVTEMVLTEMKYEVKSVMSGAECIVSLKNDHFDLLLLDVELGDTNGIELLKQIREDPDIKDTKTVFLTVSSHREDMTEAVRLGGAGLHKEACAAGDADPLCKRCSVCQGEGDYPGCR